MTETWRQIIDYPIYNNASDMGNVRNGKTGRNINSYVSSDGYVTVMMDLKLILQIWFV
jgi:hypothetical protein